jgi:predicted membrane chloride channel (bestrophin family)
MDMEGRHGGKPRQFCLEKPCHRLFWQEARRVGGRVLRRRRVRARRAAATVNESVGKSKAESKRLAAFLIAAGALAMGVEIPDLAR